MSNTFNNATFYHFQWTPEDDPIEDIYTMEDGEPIEDDDE